MVIFVVTKGNYERSKQNVFYYSIFAASQERWRRKAKLKAPGD